MERISSFSVRRSDTANVELVQAIKLYCINHGVKFNFIVLRALRKYWIEELNSGKSN